jgi:hypothetical protein
VTGRISKAGDAMVRTALYEAANAILERSAGDSPLRKWALAVAPRSTLSRRPRRHNKRRYQQVRTPGKGRPEQGPVAGTMDQVRPHHVQRCRMAYRASVSLAGRSLSDTIRRRPSR